LGALVAHAIDLAGPSLVGDPVVLARLVGPSAFSASPSAVVHAMPSAGTQQFVWHDRQSGGVRAVGVPGRYQTFDLSVDGRAIVASSFSDDGGQNLAVIDSVLGGRTPITSGAAIQDVDPRWSSNGSEVMFGSTRQARRGPQRQSVDGTNLSAPFAFSGVAFSLDDWSRDGKWLLYHDTGMPVLMARSVDGDGEPLEVARVLTGTLDQAQMSPDGTFVAFGSSDSGRDEVFVVDFRGASSGFASRRRGACSRRGAPTDVSSITWPSMGR
jgi:Tol biopolymer transport system component